MIRVYVQEFTEERGRLKHEAEHEAGRKLLGEILKEVYGVDEFALEQEARGKPWLSSHPEIKFNISHNRNLAVCAVGQVPLGVDVEMVRPFREQIFRKVLSPGELELFSDEGMGTEERQRLFFRLWTLKESYVKAEGCGIRMPLEEISFSLPRGEEIRCSQEEYSFWQKEWGDRYIISLCWKGGNQEEILITEWKNE